MKTVAQLLESKPAGVVTVAPHSTVFEALKLMADYDIGALIVVADNNAVVGILSERDYARKVILQSLSSREIPVSAIMTDRVLFVTPGQTVDECMALMTGKHIRHLPVMDENQLVGVLSIGDLVKATIHEQAFTIKQLESYIAG